MKIAIGADHAGFSLKERLREKLRRDGHELVDHGADSQQASDYPDFAAVVARDVSSGRVDRGILVCTTGVGMSIAANKVPGVRAALGVSADEVRLTRGHNDANILTFGAQFINGERAEGLVDVFLDTQFEGGRHARRVSKIAEIERSGAQGNEPQVAKA